jgi:hypothetical protein
MCWSPSESLRIHLKHILIAHDRREPLRIDQEPVGNHSESLQNGSESEHLESLRIENIAKEAQNRRRRGWSHSSFAQVTCALLRIPTTQLKTTQITEKHSDRHNPPGTRRNNPSQLRIGQPQHSPHSIWEPARINQSGCTQHVLRRLMRAQRMLSKHRDSLRMHLAEHSKHATQWPGTRTHADRYD